MSVVLAGFVAAVAVAVDSMTEVVMTVSRLLWPLLECDWLGAGRGPS